MHLIGNLGAGPGADLAVDPSGTVGGPDWALDWFVGAGDRWHGPGADRGAAVDQQRPGGLPVVETTIRVPAGHIVHRAWCTTSGGGDLAVVELENRSREAVAVGLVLRSADSGRALRFGFDGDRTATAAGRPLLGLARRPARAVAGGSREVLEVLTADAAPSPAGPVDGPAVGVVFPLAHTARLRVVLALSPGVEPGLPADLDALPGPDAVARGWQGHLDAGARVVVPDLALADAIAAARTALLITHHRDRPLGETARVALALALWGHGDAAATALADVVAHQRLDGGFGDRRNSATTASVLFALAAQSLTERGLGEAAALELAGPVAKAAHRLARRHRRGDQPPWFASAQLAAALILDRLDQPEAAELCRERIEGTHPSAVLDEMELQVPELADIAGPATSSAAARFLVETRRFLVDDTDPTTIRLLGRYPDAWLGRDLEAHAVPTGAGPLSFAVRWHGARPALLWELDASAPVTLLVGLDPTWSDDRPAGEALLAPVEPAGGLPKVLAPLEHEGTAADRAPEAGSFG